MNTDTPKQLLSASAGKLSPSGLVLRLVVISMTIAGIAGLFAYTGGWLTPHELTPAAIADRFRQLEGVHSGFRRAHAKGVDVSGYFTSNGQGLALCKAAVFQPGRVSVIGRFSLAGGQPYVADADPVPRGLAIRFAAHNGEEWRTAMLNLPVFVAATPKAFYDLLPARVPDKATGKPDPGKIEAFLTEHPDSAKAFQVIQGQPNSSGFANSTFNSLNAFGFTNTAGEVAWVRWSLVPVQPFAPAVPTDSGQADKNRLFDALIAALHAHPLEWHLIITVAQPGDPTDNATRPWPPERRKIDVGTLTIDKIESDDTSPARDMNFDPLILPNGITHSDDPLLSARSAVYSRSFIRREGEHKEPSAVSAAETGK